MGRRVGPDFSFLNISESLLEVIDKTPSENLLQSYVEVYGNMDEPENMNQMSADDYESEIFDLLGIYLGTIEGTLMDKIKALDSFMLDHTTTNTDIWNSQGAIRDEVPSLHVDELGERETAAICQDEFLEQSISNLTVTVSSNNTFEIGSRRRKHDYTDSASSDDEDLENPPKIQKFEELLAMSDPDKIGFAEFLGTFLEIRLLRERIPTTTIHYPAGSNVYYVNPPKMKKD